MSDETTTRTTSITDIPDEFPRLIDGVARHETHIVVEQDGQPVAAIIAFDEFRRIEQGTGDSDDPFAIIDRMRAAFADVPTETLEQEADRAIAAVRRRRREPATRSA